MQPNHAYDVVHSALRGSKLTIKEPGVDLVGEGHSMDSVEPFFGDVQVEGNMPA